MSEKAQKIAVVDDGERQMSAVLSLVGHNNPPEPTPFDLSREEIEGLYMEAVNWLDGSGVKTQDDADAVSKLMDMLRQAIKRADKHRSSENRAFDEGKAEVQARYAPLIADNKTQQGKAVQALDVCKKALTPFLQALDVEKRAKAEAARREADEKAAAAREAARQASLDNLEARTRSEAAAEQAKRAEVAARRAENDKPHATGGARAVGLRTKFVHELTDVRAFAAYVWKTHYDELCAFLDGLAAKQVAAGRHTLPGVVVTETKIL